MFKQFLAGIDGLDQYLIFSLVIFFLFFIAVITYLVMMKKETAGSLSRIPFDEKDVIDQTS